LRPGEGRALKTVGRASEGIRVYRRAIKLASHLGEVWWSLANLKTYRFVEGNPSGRERRGRLRKCRQSERSSELLGDPIDFVASDHQRRRDADRVFVGFLAEQAQLP